MIPTINWSEQFKVRIANSDKSFLRHEIIKCMLVMKLINKYKHNKTWIRIYTEHQINEGVKCDVYFEDVKNKNAYAFELQKDFSTKWLEDRKEKYKDWNVPYFKTSDWIPINLNHFDSKMTLEEIWDKLGEFIC
jgi:uncharacterized protein (UPF0248 family)